MNDKEIELLKKKFVVQHNLLTGAPNRFDASQKNIIYMLLVQIHKDDPIDKVYYIYIKDLERITGRELNYKQVHDSAKKLISHVYTIQDSESGALLSVALISSAKSIPGSGRIALRFDPEVRPYLFGLKRDFTKYWFWNAMSLPSKFSKQLYEILCQFKSTGILRISVYKLKYLLGLVDLKTGKEQYKMWTTFAERILDASKKEIEEYTDISFTYTVEKEGRKFSYLVFKIAPKNTQLFLEFKEELDTNFYKRLTEKFKLSAWQAKIIINHVSGEDINKILYEIQLRNINGEVKNIGGFTARIFENNYNLGLLGDKSAGIVNI